MQQPKFLFIFTPPFSGSTALVKVLNSSPNSMILTDKGEGQWLIPSLCANDRWDPNKHIDWDHVRNVWMAHYQQVNQLVSNINVVIEKSPPNILRIRELLETFPHSSCFAYNRNPYANCSSIFHRQYDPDTMDLDGRRKIMRRIAVGWLARGGYLREAIENMSMLHFTYEQFCESPDTCVDRVLKLCPDLGSVDCTAKVVVKDYPEQGITNQNERQIGLLRKDDIETINDVLGRESGLVEYFNYSLM